jgi:hypothetical protein
MIIYSIWAISLMITSDDHAIDSMEAKIIKLDNQIKTTRIQQ